MFSWITSLVLSFFSKRKVLINFGFDYSHNAVRYSKCFPREFIRLIESFGDLPDNNSIRISIFEIFRRTENGKFLTNVQNQKPLPLVYRYRSSDVSNIRGDSLSEGFPLFDAINTIADVCLEERKRGYRGSLVLSILSFSANLSSHILVDEVQRKISLCRENGIHIRLVFVFQCSNSSKLPDLLHGLCLEEGEATLLTYRKDVDDAITLMIAINELTNSIDKIVSKK